MSEYTKGKIFYVTEVMRENDFTESEARAYIKGYQQCFKDSQAPAMAEALREIKEYLIRNFGYSEATGLHTENRHINTIFSKLQQVLSQIEGGK